MKRTLKLLALILSIAFTSQVALAKDKDNNPPGPQGGRGTNWENPTGPAGGPGASPGRRPYVLQKDPVYVSPAENSTLVVPVPVATTEETYKPADLNKDGELDRFEIWLKKQEALKRHDLNHDGIVDKVERIKAFEEFKASKTE